MPKPGSEGHGKSGHLSDRLRRKAPQRYFTFSAKAQLSGVGVVRTGSSSSFGMIPPHDLASQNVVEKIAMLLREVIIRRRNRMQRVFLSYKNVHKHIKYYVIKGKIFMFGSKDLTLLIILSSDLFFSSMRRKCR